MEELDCLVIERLEVCIGNVQKLKNLIVVKVIFLDFFNHWRDYDNLIILGVTIVSDIILSCLEIVALKCGPSIDSINDETQSSVVHIEQHVNYWQVWNGTSKVSFASSVEIQISTVLVEHILIIHFVICVLFVLESLWYSFEIVNTLFEDGSAEIFWLAIVLVHHRIIGLYSSMTVIFVFISNNSKSVFSDVDWVRFIFAIKVTIYICESFWDLESFWVHLNFF